jgi:hypothetical protein
MPAVASLTNSASTLAFTVPTNAAGFILWNENAANLRVRFGAEASASGTTLGIPLPGGTAAAPNSITHYFSRPLTSSLGVFIYQASGGAITTGVGYEILTR